MPPKRQVVIFFLLPTRVIPAQPRLTQRTDTRQFGNSPLGQQQAQTGAAQQQIIQMQHQLLLGGPRQFGP